MNKKSKISDKVYQELYKKFRDKKGIVAPLYAHKVVHANMLYGTDEEVKRNLMYAFSTDTFQRVKIGYVSAVKNSEGDIQFSTAICSPADYFTNTNHNAFDSKYGKFLAMTKALSGNGHHNAALRDVAIIMKDNGIYYFSEGNTPVAQYNRFVERSMRYYFPPEAKIPATQIL